MTAPAGLDVRNLLVRRGGIRVLHGVSLVVRPGEVTALLGANGAGKSSLVATVAGLIPTEGGTVALDGAFVLGRKTDRLRRDGLAVVLEGHRVLGDLTLLDNLRAAGSGLGRVELGSEVERMLALFPELKERLAVRAYDLSGGQKQMVVIAQALIGRPRYLLVDELSLGLAPAVVIRLAEAMRMIAASGVGVLLVEQFTTLALKLAARAYLMERGRIVFSGSSQALRDDPSILHSAYLANSASASAPIAPAP